MRGDETAEKTRRFQDQVLIHLDAAYGLARYMTRDPVAAEDIVQDAFLRAHRAFDGFRGGDARAWLLTIVRNNVRSWAAARRDRAEQALESLPGQGAEIADDAAPTPEAWLAAQEDAADLRALIEGLPPAFRETLLLREMEEMSYRDIAAVTGAPVGTVMSRLARARDLLAAAWRRREAGETR
ncbi:RNA polymerase sigma-70 factor (ECF subfamily) [Nitrospirillum amazonense]|uniref:RNA polymerase sigma-70 factor (ECF subfamily) n=1 Tax=Nitrospirillum amazonense TaxID=28077 RepID=A0A560FNV7_9PROT|nr:sigma-70 family RNA polymerase sigma factor [Nitrospirillum amazonense]TWB23303.1 RNA polymerase sigma-70 factor (ECF subfamily) [Nitrospirillum amazonense]